MISDVTSRDDFHMFVKGEGQNPLRCTRASNGACALIVDQSLIHLAGGIDRLVMRTPSVVVRRSRVGKINAHARGAVPARLPQGRKAAATQLSTRAELRDT